MQRNVNGYLPTKCKPGKVVFDFEITVLMILMKTINCYVCIYCIPAMNSPVYHVFACYSKPINSLWQYFHIIFEYYGMDDEVIFE